MSARAARARIKNGMFSTPQGKRGNCMVLLRPATVDISHS